MARRGASAAVTNPLEALDFAQIVRPGDTVTWGQASAEPLPLTRALIAQRRAVGGRFKVFLGVGYSDSVTPEAADCIDISAYCGAGANRALSEAGALDILPCHYSQYPELIRSGALKIDVLLLQTAPPDEQGRYSLGIAHEYLVAAFDAARVVIAEVNDQAPWTHGERALVEADFDFIVRTSRRPLLPAPRSPSAVERAVAAKVAGLIEDGATLQFGLGTLPEAVLAGLGGFQRGQRGGQANRPGDGVEHDVAWPRGGLRDRVRARQHLGLREGVANSGRLDAQRLAHLARGVLPGHGDHLGTELQGLGRQLAGVPSTRGQPGQPEPAGIATHDVRGLGPDRAGRAEEDDVTDRAAMPGLCCFHGAIVRHRGPDGRRTRTRTYPSRRTGPVPAAERGRYPAAGRPAGADSSPGPGPARRTGPAPGSPPHRRGRRGDSSRLAGRLRRPAKAAP